MKNRISLLLIFVASMLFATVAVAAGLPPSPTLVEGRSVYTIPDGFVPSKVGRAGLEEINRNLAKLHYRFIVVFEERLPSAGEIAMVDALVNDFRLQGNYDVGTTSVLAIAATPSKYGFSPASRWKVELGIAAPSAKFDSYAIRFTSLSKAQDQKGGVLALAFSIDEDAFDQTDPVRVAARAEAQRREQARLAAQAESDRQERAAAEVIRKRREASATLENYIATMISLIHEAPEYPEIGDLTGYRLALDSAKLARGGADDVVLTAASNLSVATVRLDGLVSAQRNQARIAWFVKFLIAAAFSSCVTLLATRLNKRRKLIASTRERVAAKHAEWETKVGNASLSYAAFDADREEVAATSRMVGATAELYKSVTEEVDDIYVLVRAMTDRLVELKARAAKAGSWDLKAWQQALNDVEAIFVFDTGVIDASALFGTPTKTLKIDPWNAFTQLEERFKKTITKWNTLKAAASGAAENPKDGLPRAAYDRAVIRAKKHGIPEDPWLVEHPVAHPSVVASCEILRNIDPIGYTKALVNLKDKATFVLSRFDDVAMAVSKVRNAESFAAKHHSAPLGTSLERADDPSVTLAAARKAVADFDARLGSMATSTIDAEATALLTAYDKVAKQYASASLAIESLPRTVAAATKARDAACAELAVAVERLDQASQEHVVTKPKATLASVTEHLKHGDTWLGAAKEMSAKQQLLDASRHYATARGHFENASRAAAETISQCNALAAAKVAYLASVAALPQRRAQAAAAVQGYATQLKKRGANFTDALSSIERHGLMGQVDYAEQLRFHQQQANEWALVERRARDQAEEYNRRDREAEARVEQARRDAHEAEQRAARAADDARRASYTSSYSSGGGDYGGSSGSGGGDCGGSSGSGGGDC
jgi:uncharacterized membrane protein YgcG